MNVHTTMKNKHIFDNIHIKKQKRISNLELHLNELTFKFEKMPLQHIPTQQNCKHQADFKTFHLKLLAL